MIWGIRGGGGGGGWKNDFSEIFFLGQYSVFPYIFFVTYRRANYSFPAWFDCTNILLLYFLPPLPRSNCWFLKKRQGSNLPSCRTFNNNLTLKFSLLHPPPPEIKLLVPFIKIELAKAPNCPTFKNNLRLKFWLRPGHKNPRIHRTLFRHTDQGTRRPFPYTVPSPFHLYTFFY